MLAAMPWLNGRAELAPAIGQPLRHRIAWYFHAVYSAKVRQLAATSFVPALCRHIVVPNGLTPPTGSMGKQTILNPLGASLFRSSTEPE
jgi:hypothetical protein